MHLSNKLLTKWSGSWSFSNFWNQRLYVMEVDCNSSGGGDITINCPGDQSFDIAPGLGVPINFIQPQPSTTCTSGGLILTQTNGPASGTALTAGTYNVSYSATDACGNSAQCSFIVTVNQTMGGGCPTSLPNFTKLGEFNGNAYFISDDIARAEDGQAAANSVGGHLVTINSQAENDFLTPLVTEGVVYIGANDAASEGNLAWFDGTAFSYENFDICSGCQGNEDNKDYVIFHSWNGGWSWSNFWSQRRYVIEVPCMAPLNSGNNNTLIAIPSTKNVKQTTIANVMPNPADDYLFVKMMSEKEETVDLQLFDARGVLQQTVKVDMYKGFNSKELDISELPAGLYYVMIPQGQKNSRVVKFVKQRM